MKRWKEALFLIVLFGGIAAIGLCGDTRNEGDARAELSKGMTCVLGGRPVARDAIRARLDEIAAKAKARGEARWPTICAQFFRAAARVSEHDSLAGAADAIDSADLARIEDAVRRGYDVVDWSQPE